MPQLMFGGAVFGTWVDWIWICGMTILLGTFHGPLGLWRSWCLRQDWTSLTRKTLQVVYLGAGEVSGQHHNVASTREMLSTKFNELISCGTMKPKPWDGPILIDHNGRIYSFGGEDLEKKSTFFKEVWELNLSSRRWSECELEVASHIICRHYRCRWRAVKSRTDLPVRLFTFVTTYFCIDHYGL